MNEIPSLLSTSNAKDVVNSRSSCSNLCNFSTSSALLILEPMRQSLKDFMRLAKVYDMTLKALPPTSIRNSGFLSFLGSQI